jgi:hypothetical protein
MNLVLSSHWRSPALATAFVVGVQFHDDKNIFENVFSEPSRFIARNAKIKAAKLGGITREHAE